METDYMLVRHSRKEQPIRVTVEKKGFDLSNYSFLRMSPQAKQSMAE